MNLLRKLNLKPTEKFILGTSLEDRASELTCGRNGGFIEQPYSYYNN